MGRRGIGERAWEFGAKGRLLEKGSSEGRIQPSGRQEEQEDIEDISTYRLRRRGRGDRVSEGSPWRKERNSSSL